MPEELRFSRSLYSVDAIGVVEMNKGKPCRRVCSRLGSRGAARDEDNRYQQETRNGKSSVHVVIR